MTIAQQVARVAANVEVSTRSREFIALAKCVALGRGGHAAAAKIAEDARLSKAVIGILGGPHKVFNLSREQILTQRAAVGAGTTTDATWGGPLAAYQTLADAFLESLRHFGAFDKLLGSMKRVGFRVRIVVSTAAITGTGAAQASAKPLSRLTLAGAEIAERKAVALLVTSAELAKFGTAPDLFGAELSAAVATATDSAFASILTNGAPSIVSSGPTAEHFRSDLRALLSLVSTSARSQLFLLMPPAISKALSALHTNTGGPALGEGFSYKGGPIIGGVEGVVSDGIASGVMILTDAQQLAGASDAIALSASDQAVVQFDDAPDSPPTASTNLVSLWQSDMIGLRAERAFGCEKLGTGAAAVLTGANFEGDSPGP